MSASINLGTIRNTHVANVTATPSQFAFGGPYGSCVIYSTTDCYLSTNGDTVSDQDFLLKADTYIKLSLDGAQLSWVVADASPDGVIRVTETG